MALKARKQPSAALTAFMQSGRAVYDMPGHLKDELTSLPPGVAQLLYESSSQAQRQTYRTPASSSEQPNLVDMLSRRKTQTGQLAFSSTKPEYSSASGPDFSVADEEAAKLAYKNKTGVWANTTPVKPASPPSPYAGPENSAPGNLYQTAGQQPQATPATRLTRELLQAIGQDAPGPQSTSATNIDLDAMLLEYTNRGYDLSELRIMLRSGFAVSGTAQTISNARKFLDRRLPAIAKAQSLGLTPREATMALEGTDPLESSSVQYDIVRSKVLGTRRLVRSAADEERQFVSELEQLQSPASRRAQLGTMKPVVGGQLAPGHVIRDKAVQQFNLRETLGASMWPTEEGMVRTGLEDPSKLPKRFQQAVGPYEQVFLSGKPVVEAPWRTGPTSDAPERGQILRTALIFGGALPEGMSMVEQSLGQAENLRRVGVDLPVGFTPELAEVGTAWGQGETAALFKGHTGIQTGDWTQHELMSRTFTPGTEQRGGRVEALLKRSISTTQGLGLSFDFAKDLLVGGDIGAKLGEPGFEMLKSGGVRDVYGAAYAAMSAMTPAQFKEVTGMDMPPTWQEAATTLTDIFSGKVASGAARDFDISQVLSWSSLEQFKEAGRVVGTPEDIGGGRFRATLRFPGLDIPMFTRMTRSGTQQHRQPFIAAHTLDRIRRNDPVLFAQMMEEDKYSRSGQARRAVAQSYLASGGFAEPPKHTAAADVSWESIMTRATQEAMKATGAKTPESIPMGALQSALLNAVPREFGALKFTGKGKDYYFPNPANMPRVGGGLGWEERSAFRWQLSGLIQAQANRGTSEDGERTYQKQLIETAFAQHWLASSPEFFRKLRGAEPSSIIGGVAGASYANLPGEVFMSTEKAARAMGIQPDSKEFDAFKEQFESGATDIPGMNIFREPVTSAQGVQVQARGRWIGAHPEKALRGSDVPILSPEIGQALFGDFDKDDYLIAANFGVDLQTAKQMRESDESIVQMARSGVAGQSQKQLEEMARFKDVPEMLNWLQSTRSAISPQDIERQFAERKQTGGQMGVGFNIQQRLLAAAPSKQARSVADVIGGKMYMSAQDYERWQGPMAELARLGTAKTGTGGTYYGGMPGRVAFGAAGMMGATATMVGGFDFLDAEQKALTMVPSGNPGLLREVTTAFESGDTVAVVEALEKAMPGGTAQWGQETMMGRYVVAQAAEREQRKGGQPLTPELAETGGMLRALSNIGKGAKRSLLGKMRAGLKWASLAGSPTGVEAMLREPGVTVPVAPGPPPVSPPMSEFDTMMNEWLREQGSPITRTSGTAGQPFEDWLGENYGRSPYELAGSGAPSPGASGGGRGRGPRRGAPPVTPPGEDEPQRRPSSGSRDLVLDKAGNIVFRPPVVTRGELLKSVELLESRLGEWADATKDATAGTREYTKWEEQRTKEIQKAASTVQKAKDYPEGLVGRNVAGITTRGMALMDDPNWARIAQSEQAMQAARWTPPSDGGPGGPRRPRSIYEGDLGQMAYGLFNAQRLWRYTGGQVAKEGGEYAQYVGQEQQAIASLGLGEGVTGAPADVMSGRAAWERTKLGLGKAAWDVWGFLPRTLGKLDSNMEGGRGARMGALARPLIGGAIGARLLGNIAGKMGMSTVGGALSGAGKLIGRSVLPIMAGYGALETAQAARPELYGGSKKSVFGGGFAAVNEFVGAGAGGASMIAGSLGWEGGQRFFGNAAGLFGRQARRWKEATGVGQGRDTGSEAQQQFSENVRRLSEEAGITPEAAIQAIQSYGQATGRTDLSAADFEGLKRWAMLPSGGAGQGAGAGASWATTLGLGFGTPEYAAAVTEGQLGTPEEKRRRGWLGQVIEPMQSARTSRGFEPLSLRAGMTQTEALDVSIEQGRQRSMEDQLMAMGAGIGGAGRAVERLGDAGNVLGFGRMLGGDQWEMSRMAGDQGTMQTYMGALSEVLNPEDMAALGEMARELTPIIDTETGLRVGVVSNTATAEFGAAALAATPKEESALVRHYAMIGSRERQDAQLGLQRGYQDFQTGQRKRQLGWSQVSQFGGEFEGFQTRGSFAIQTELRKLSRIWEDFTQKYNEQQRAVQYSQFMENWQVRAQRAPVQFQRQREDLSFRGAQASMQYGWGQEDIQESLRYATGRDRRKLLKQQERQTISYAMQMGQMDVQGGRIDENERWSQEDLERQKRHFLERFALQDEYQFRFSQYMEQRRMLEDELQGIREFGARLNIDMQTEALGKIETLQEQMRAIQDAQIITGQYMENNVALAGKFGKTLQTAITDGISAGKILKDVMSNINMSVTQMNLVSQQIIEGWF